MKEEKGTSPGGLQAHDSTTTTGTNTAAERGDSVLSPPVGAGGHADGAAVCGSPVAQVCPVGRPGSGPIYCKECDAEYLCCPHCLERIGTWACPERMGKRERAATPIPFRDLLLSIAATAWPAGLVEVTP